MPDFSNSLSQIDWPSVRKRTAAALSVTETAAVLSPERARQILTDRARALAVPAEDEAAADETVDAVMFRLSRERYAIETRYVREVVPLQKITSLPQTAGFVAGIIILRGELIPVFDLRTFLGIAADAAIAPSHILIAGERQSELGIPVCALPQAGSISLSKLAAIADQGMNDGRSLLRGVTGDSLVVIDGLKLITDRRFFLE